MPSYDLLARGDTASRAVHLAALQRAVGNHEVTRLLAALAQSTHTSTTSPAVSSAFGGVSLHGQTDATFDGGVSSVDGAKIARAKGCDCPEGETCLRTTGTLVAKYSVAVTIEMPDMPSGLTTCQRRRVAAFLSDVLRPHEDEHARRFRTYNGTTRRAIEARGCGRDGLQTALEARAHEMHDAEAVDREAAARKLSGAIDPFTRGVDLDCT